ncbi:MAG: 50S ribosomal protein L35 [Planctomycetes bacterium]|nr:50S ribosomal protein L35 [Planctomycetota bacterium]
MPKQKQKTHKGLAKRVKVSANGKIKHRKPGKGHLMSVKSSKRLRKIRRPSTVALPAYAAKMIAALHS